MSFPANNPRACPSVLFINGFLGVGKLSVAREVQKKLDASRLLDNHLLIDVAQTIEPNRSPAHYALRTALRRAAFDRLKAVEDISVTLVLTSCSASTLPYDAEGKCRTRDQRRTGKGQGQADGWTSNYRYADEAQAAGRERVRGEDGWS
ncbi:hypothetical protein DFH08DRAFT_873811 [Mycena albidolilacea]|uniref:Uncharacterized protein n=1 Tax=Mycena albidolilacea TaxID=1033008 RepID=A0AAD6ZWF1_9AGAR|nr:hypothetical protein DFH08DRAFT_873811 [Mycena albidolilacea]